MEMAITFNIQVYFCIFFSFLHTEGTHNKKKNADIINNFLHLPGWKNINDVESIKYRCKDYKLNELINQTVTTIECDNFIRQATIFLGCSYAHDLNIMFFVLLNFQKHCFQIFFTGNWYKTYDCTVTLLVKMNEIIPVAKFMKGALFAIEKYHNIPMNNHKKNRFILKKVLTNLQENEELNKLFNFYISMDSIKSTLLSIADILRQRKRELKEDLSFCELKPFDLDLLWNIWNMEFNTLKSQRIYQEFYIFLNDKIKYLILTTIWKKYIELGFKFDLNSSQTFLPTPPTNNNQDTTQNPIHLTEHTNELDVLEDIQQHDLIHHTNEENVMKTILYEYIAQYSFINLVQPTNEVDKQDGIKKEDVTCEAKNDSNLQIEYTDDMIPYYKFF
ncbi:uncharacterized protein LOC126894416 isoform X2 [Daktulosphaira vitifoliae]|uniref:uncharacterized protein LOC126894416 isoform X2 n=1 Tax=Daktulosphaira vitifoliae TaxID=58002 RepID=UPI0021AAC88A|nr:uncharacterized protein LOC126894416 isoform X2 [Daktulosphaira vitifoliae]